MGLIILKILATFILGLVGLEAMDMAGDMATNTNYSLLKTYIAVGLWLLIFAECLGIIIWIWGIVKWT